MGNGNENGPATSEACVMWRSLGRLPLNQSSFPYRQHLILGRAWRSIHSRGTHPDTTRIVQYPATDTPVVLVDDKFHVTTGASQVKLFVSRSSGDDTWQEEPIDSVTVANDNATELEEHSSHWIQSHALLRHFLPAQFPASVASGYLRYVTMGFVASVAGSAGMVLSTQCLLVAVVGGSGTGTDTAAAPVLAGALNWILKDGIGQVGGVLFASHMGETRTFDSSPKRWRTVAAICLDVASLMEVVALSFNSSPMFLLAIASSANVLKNIGFLTASASRVALNQSMAIKKNLADVTAKAGSQSVAASLLGTTFGIGLSLLLGQGGAAEDTMLSFAAALTGLIAIHQGCLYASLTAVPLRHLDQHRLYLILQAYVNEGVVLTPKEVADKEVFLPLIQKDDTNEWLRIGSDLHTLCPQGPKQLDKLLDASSYQPYVLARHDDIVHLTFIGDAAGERLVQGMLHAARFRKKDHVPLFGEIRKECNDLTQEMLRQGWTIGPDDTHVEPAGAVRLFTLIRKAMN